MDLLIDIGNTRGKMVVAEGRRWVEEVAFSAEEMTRLMGKYPIARAIASVVGEMPDFGALMPPMLQRRFHLLGVGSPLPIRMDYETPDTLGPDRIAAVVGAQAVYSRGSLLVVDAGSCITLDYLDSEKVYRGGAIMPGIGMKFRAMNTFTAKLPLLDDNYGKVPLVGKSTRGSMQTGVLNGTHYELEGFLAQYRREDPSVKMVLTGGDADLLSTLMEERVEVNHHLVWEGLADILGYLSI